MANRLSGDFMVDYDESSDTTTIVAFRGDRSVDLNIRRIVDEKDQSLSGYEATIVRGTFMPSLERKLAGYRGILANDTYEQAISNAKVEELIVALQWLVDAVPAR